jgi:hypothetical protein
MVLNLQNAYYLQFFLMNKLQVVMSMNINSKT